MQPSISILVSSSFTFKNCQVSYAFPHSHQTQLAASCTPVQTAHNLSASASPFLFFSCLLFTCTSVIIFFVCFALIHTHQNQLAANYSPLQTAHILLRLRLLFLFFFFSFSFSFFFLCYFLKILYPYLLQLTKISWQRIVLLCKQLTPILCLLVHIRVE